VVGFLEELLFALAGCFLGIFTGLTPGIHVNTVSLVALGFLGQGNTGFIAMVASMSVVHTFVDFVPSILLGSPDDETFLGVLPGHRMLLKGRGFEAVGLTVAGGLFAGLLSIALSPLFVLALEKADALLPAIIPFALAIILISMALDERKKLSGIAVILLSAALGMVALEGNLALKEPLLCLATGFFGASTLVDSIAKNPGIVGQKKKEFRFSPGGAFGKSLVAFLGGCLVSVMPGIGASQAAFIARKALGKMGTKGYLVLLGGVNTSTMILSFFVLYSIGKARTGSAVAISQMGSFGLNQLLVVVGACLLGIGFGAIATTLVAVKAAGIISKLDYRKLNAIVLAVVSAVVAVFSGTAGLAFYGVACAIGLVSIRQGTKRSGCMSFLIVPTIAHYAAGFL